MIKVNDLKKRNKNRYIVSLNDKDYDVDENLILHYHLVKGKIIDDDSVLDEIIADIPYYDFYDIALSYIEKKLKSSGEIKFYLKRKGASEEIIQRIVSYFVEHHLIDDERYLQVLIDHYLINGYGPNVIINKAKEKFIPSNIISAVDFDDYSEELTEYCQKIAQKKLKLIKDADKNQIKIKLQRYLLSRGYEYYMINNIVKEIL